MKSAGATPSVLPADIGNPDGRFETSDGAVIPYRVRGSGPALIMLHGWSQSGAMFHHQLSALSDGYTVIVPDLRGHGESPTPAGGLRISRLSADVLELMDHLGIAQVHMLGWSMGASVALSFIDLYGTDRIDRLILVDQPLSLTVHSDMSDAERLECGSLFTLEALGDLRGQLLSPEGAAVRAGFVESMVTPSIPPVLLDWIQQENAKTDLHVAAALLWSHCAQDWRDVAARIDRPCLVICGAISHVPPASQYYVKSLVRNADIREFTAEEGGAHFMFLEAPAVFNRCIREFLG